MRIACARVASTTWLAAVAAACATTSVVPVAPSADRIPQLEAEVTRSPADAQRRVLLGAAYRSAGRHEEAAGVLEPSATGNDPNPAALLLLGMTYEELGRFGEAGRLYRSYLDRRGARARGEVAARLTLVERKLLEQAVRDAVAQEEALGARVPQAATIAVFPFQFGGQDTTLRPLGRALAELLTTDLSLTNRLTVLERTQLQLLLDEIRLGESAYVDPATAARAGRMLGAGRLVQGRIGGGTEELELQAVVVAVPTAELPPPVERRGPLANLLDMEAELALAIYEAVGVQLTAAERARVGQRPTENVQALIAFGYGLEAADAGDFAAAARHFENAAALDPNFGLATERLDETRRLDFAESLPAVDQTALALAELGPVMPEWQLLRERFLPVDELVPDPDARDATSELLGTESLDRGAIIEIVIRRPAGSQ